MHLGQEGIVFKLYATPSETQPIIRTDKGNEAKKDSEYLCVLSTDFKSRINILNGPLADLAGPTRAFFILWRITLQRSLLCRCLIQSIHAFWHLCGIRPKLPLHLVIGCIVALVPAQKACTGCLVSDNKKPAQLSEAAEYARVSRRRAAYVQFPILSYFVSMQMATRQKIKLHQTHYGISLIANGRAAASLGLEAFRLRGGKRWICPQCGDFSLHDGVCATVISRSNLLRYKNHSGSRRCAHFFSNPLLATGQHKMWKIPGVLWTSSQYTLYRKCKGSDRSFSDWRYRLHVLDRFVHKLHNGTSCIRRRLDGTH